jgi:transposase
LLPFAALAFLRHIQREVPKDLDVHMIVDNYGTHKHAKVKAWLARHARFHLHYTPTYSSWLNQVERWFGMITQRAIRRGSFDSVPDLKRKINEFPRIASRNFVTRCLMNNVTGWLPIALSANIPFTLSQERSDAEGGRSSACGL